MRKKDSILLNLKFAFSSNKSMELPDFHNELSLSLPQKKKSLIRRLFPNYMIIFLVLAIAIKLKFFLYGVNFYQTGTSRTLSSIFVQWANHWWDLEGLCDFGGDYIMFRNNWIAGEPLYSEAFGGRYLYPPLFYYMINIFSKWTVFSAPIVMLICSILTGFFIFHLAKNLGASGRASNIMMLIYLLSPINLFYSDFIWQNAGVVTLFVVISMYCISKNKNTMGMFWLGIAISVKQIAAFFLPVFVVAIIYKNYFKPKEQYQSNWTFLEYIRSIPYTQLFYYMAIPCWVFILASMPYIFTMPEEYFGYLLSGGPVDVEWLSSIFKNIVGIKIHGKIVGYFPDLTLGDNDPYQMNYRAVLDVAFAWLGHIWGISTDFTAIFAILFHTQIFMYGSVLLILLLIWPVVKKKQFSSEREFLWFIWYAAGLCLNGAILFAEIGIYKYYFLSITPIWAMFGWIMPLNYKKWIDSGNINGINLISETISQKSILKSLKKLGNGLLATTYGGGSFFHFISQMGFQIFLLYTNKWLAPAYLYLPIFLLGIIRLIYFNWQKNSHITNEMEL
ncbi:MAG: hypothetical protein ACTSVU_02150 [Promethearchaeota archaeon]